VLRRGLPLEAALERAAAGLDRPDDRAFAHAMAAEALRRLPDLDALIDGATGKRLPDDAKARFVLRLALVQALALGTPPHAAIATTLPLVDGGPRRLVHGVFGTLLRNQARLPEPPTLPAAVARRWRRAWGEAAVAAAARLIATPPPIDLAFAAGAEPAGLDGVSLMPGHLRLARTTAITGLTGYGEGGWWVQDVAASMPARMLGQGNGRHALDLCAAPGGKTMQLAAAGWKVTAVDISEPRIARLADNLGRTGLAAEIVAADLFEWQPPTPADAILLDAPCSATGIFRRHPDVLHRVRPAAIGALAANQQAMLARAAQWLKPGGSLVYSVCSLEPEEGEEVVGTFLEANPGFRKQEERRLLPGLFEAEGGADSFYIARLIR
jgi:16S rRNA (cytosine967-C5)-methyltransferase